MKAVGLPIFLLYHFSRWQQTCKYRLIDATYRVQACAFHREGCGKGYVVKPADTCESICAANYLNRAQFNSLNPAVDCSKIIAGQVLCVMPGEAKQLLL